MRKLMEAVEQLDEDNTTKLGTAANRLAIELVHYAENNNSDIDELGQETYEFVMKKARRYIGSTKANVTKFQKRIDKGEITTYDNPSLGTMYYKN